MTMTPLDYGHSFMIGTAPANEIRICVESRTRITDDASGRTEDYLQCTSCKSEETFVERDLFQEDNYDFMTIYGPEYVLIFRRKAWLNPNYRDCLPTTDLWGGASFHLTECATAQELTTPADILQATYDWYPIVAQTEIHNSDTGRHAIIEYPVKMMNTMREETLYQADTGPLAFPDLGQPAEKLVDIISLAYVAFNVPRFADFVIEVPTSIGDESDGTEVYHYSKRVTLEATNRLYAIM
jgi:hypothetical protein